MSRNFTTLGWIACIGLAAALVTQAVAQDPGEKGPPDPEDVPKAVAELQDRVDRLERQLAQAKKDRAVLQGELAELSKTTNGLSKRVEDIDRNKFAAIDREIAKTNREVADIDRRLKRIE